MVTKFLRDYIPSRQSFDVGLDNHNCQARGEKWAESDFLRRNQIPFRPLPIAFCRLTNTIEARPCLNSLFESKNRFWHYRVAHKSQAIGFVQMNIRVSEVQICNTILAADI